MSNENVEAQRWLGYELHDGLLQWVVGARMKLEVAVGEAQDPEHRRKLQDALRYMELAIDEGRELIGFLVDQTAPHNDFESMLRQFVGAIRPLVEDVEQVVELVPAERAWPPLSQSLIWNLLRITQQAVRNAVQHAGPARILISLGWEDQSHLRIEVTDNGQGFDIENRKPTRLRTSHFGVSSMRHRAALIRGVLEIKTAPGEGCVVRLTVPVAEQAHP